MSALRPGNQLYSVSVATKIAVFNQSVSLFFSFLFFFSLLRACVYVCVRPLHLMFNNKRDERYYLYLYCLAFRSEGLVTVLTGQPSIMGAALEGTSIAAPHGTQHLCKGDRTVAVSGCDPLPGSA